MAAVSGDGYVYVLHWANVEADNDLVQLKSVEKMEMYDTTEESARRYAAKVAAREGAEDVTLRRRPEPQEWEDLPL